MDDGHCLPIDPSISRRSLIQYLGACALATVTFGVGARAQAGNLRVTHFGGPYQILRDLVGRPFAAEGLGTVSYEAEFSSSALAKLQAQVNDPPFDIAMLPRAVALRASNAGLTATISAQDIPNLSSAVDGTLYQGIGVAFIMDGVDLMYNKAKVSAPVKSWPDLWRPEFAGKLALPAFGTALPVNVVIAVTRAFGGNEHDDKAVDDAFRRLRELKSSVRAFVSDPNQATQLIERGEIIAAPQFSIRIANAMKANAEIDRATPFGLVQVLPYDLVIAKNSSNLELAKKYINFVISERIQSNVASALLATPVARHASLAPETERFIIKDSRTFFQVDEPFVASKTAGWLTRWQREIQS